MKWRSTNDLATGHGPANWPAFFVARELETTVRKLREDSGAPPTHRMGRRRDRLTGGRKCSRLDTGTGEGGVRGDGATSNIIIGGIFFHAVVHGRAITVQRPSAITPALSGLPVPASAFTGRDEHVE